MHEKFKSRKFWLTVVTLAGVACGVLPPSVLFGSGAYVLGQGLVDAAAERVKP